MTGHSRPLLLARATRILLGLLAGGACLLAAAGDWMPLNKDEVHDPRGPAVRILQEPREALSKLPPDSVGNQVRWIEALERGFINPRTNIRAGTEVRTRDTDILMDLYGSMPIVRFPHRRHTLWLDCSNCHEHVFKSQLGGNRISMLSILEGEQCGLCHGAVSFPLTECGRCHSVSRRDYLPPPGLRAVLVPEGRLPGDAPPVQTSQPANDTPAALPPPPVAPASPARSPRAAAASAAPKSTAQSGGKTP